MKRGRSETGVTGTRRWPCLLSAVVALGLPWGVSLAELAVRPGDRLVIYGDSITAGTAYPAYPRYVEAFIRMRFPDADIQVWNRGWSGDTAANLERFKRDCLSLKPTLITINMGMNDAGYSPGIAPGLRKFIGGLRRMVEEARAVVPQVRVFLVSPILYEFDARESRSFYPYTLWCYSREEKRLANELGVDFIDLNRQYGQTVGLAHGMFPETLVFSADGIHPIPNGGHLFIAVHMLRGLGFPPELAFLSVAADTGKMPTVRGQDARVIEASGKQVVLERTLHCLPVPTVSSSKGVPYLDRAVAFLECVDEDLNRDILGVTGLSAKGYRLSIDGQDIADLQAEELAEGVNLSRFCGTPDQDQASRVCDAVGLKQTLDGQCWHQGLRQGTGSSDQARLQAEIADAIREVKALSVPKPHRLTLSALDYDVDRYRRYEQCLQITGPAVLAVGAGAPPVQDVPIRMVNLSAARRKVEVFWSNDRIVPSSSAMELEPGQEQSLTCKATIEMDDAPPVLRVKHRPADGSFPALVQHLCIPLKTTVDVPHARGPIQVDGDLSDWQTGAVLSLDKRMPDAVLRRRHGPDDLSVAFRLAWNAQSLYVGVAVRDQDHTSHFTDDRAGWDDAVFLAVSAAGQGRSPGLQCCLALTAGGAKVEPEPPKGEAFPFAIQRGEGATVYEVALPLGALSTAKPEAGATYTFRITVNDRDSDESCKSVDWSGTADGGPPGLLRLLAP